MNYFFEKMEGNNIIVDEGALFIMCRDPRIVGYVLKYHSKGICSVSIMTLPPERAGILIHCDERLANAIDFTNRFSDSDVDEFNAIDRMIGKRLDRAFSKVHSCDYQYCGCYACDRADGYIVDVKHGITMIMGRILSVDRVPSTDDERASIASSFWFHFSDVMEVVNSKSANHI